MAIRTNGNITGKLTSGTVNLKGNLSNTVISFGTTNYDELENKPDLSVYALREVTYEEENGSSTLTYRQDEYSRLIGSIDINARDAKSTANFSLDIAASKADKEHTHDEYATTEYVDNAIGNIDIGEIDLSKYATTRVSRIKDWDEENQKIIYEHEDLTQDDFAILIGDIESSAFTSVDALADIYGITDQINLDLKDKAELVHQHSYNDIHDIQENFVTREEFENSKELFYPSFEPNVTLYPGDVNTVRYIKVYDNIIITMPNINQGDIPELSEMVIYLAMTETNATVTFEDAYRWQQEIPELEMGTTYEFIFTYVNGKWLGGYIAYKNMDY